MCGASSQEEEVRPAEDLAGDFCGKVLSEELWTGLSEQQPLHLPGAASALPGLFEASGLLEAFARGSGTGAVAATKRGQQHDGANFFMAYLSQATLSLEGAERFFPVLLELCQSLASAFDYVTSRLVLDPPGCGPRPLSVDADLLLVQLWGEQRLTIFKPFEAGAPALRPESLLEPQLRPGDVLFVPCGLGCRLLGSGAPLQSRGASAPRGGARAGAGPRGPSLCAVLKVRGEQQSFATSLQEYFSEVLLRTELSGDADGFFRSAVTKRSLPDRYAGTASAEAGAAGAREELEARLRRCAEELALHLGAASGLRGRHAARMERLREAQRRGAVGAGEAAAGPQESLRLASPRARVRVAKGVECRCEPGASVAFFTRGGATLNLPIAESASHLINKLSDGRPHVVDSLPCEDPIERICVCNVLVFKECLELVEDGGPEL